MNPHHQSDYEFKLDNRVFRECLQAVGLIHGDFVELGVFRGNSLMEVIRTGKNQGKHVHAFDSFRGMAEPVKEDMEPETNHTIYPKWYLDQGGPEYLINRLSKSGYTESDYTIWAGFIPEIFGTVKDKLTFSFAYVDLDHYKPTKYALEWVWERLSPLGLMVCDDFFISQLWGTSTLAITEFIEKHVTEFDIARRTGRRIIFRKR